jgi:glycosyltransferase involved in cell wall biosynthesis
MSDEPDLSVVVACYNEEGILEESFAELVDTLDHSRLSVEIVFVDDASRDRTPAIISRLVERHSNRAVRALFHERNQGRGATVTDGFRASRGKIAGYLDIDLEVHCRYIPSLVRAIDRGADVATVRRIYAFQLRSLDRYVQSRGYSWLIRHLLGVPLHDTETGYKFFRRTSLMPIIDEIEDPGWFWDTEFMVRAYRRGLRIDEVPGAFVRRFDVPSTVQSWRDSWTYFSKLLQFRRLLRSGGI